MTQPNDTYMKPLRNKAERAQFKFELFMMMQMSGRDEEAVKAFNEGLELLREFNEGDTSETTD